MKLLQLGTLGFYVLCSHVMADIVIDENATIKDSPTTLIGVTYPPILEP